MEISTTLPSNLTTSWIFSKSPEGGHCEQLLTRHHPVLQGEFPLGGRREKNRTVFKKKKKKNWKQLPELGLCPESCRKRPQTSWSPAASPGLFPGPLQVSYPQERAGLRASWGGPISPAPSLKDVRLCWSKRNVSKLLYFWSFFSLPPLPVSQNNPISFLRFWWPKQGSFPVACCLFFSILPSPCFSSPSTPHTPRVINKKPSKHHPWHNGKESTCQCRGHRFNPSVRKIPWRRAWQPAPGFLPGKIPWSEETGRLQSMGSQRVRHNWASTQNIAQPASGGGGGWVILVDQLPPP